jgi:hypothetical protein
MSTGVDLRKLAHEEQNSEKPEYVVHYKYNLGVIPNRVRVLIVIDQVSEFSGRSSSNNGFFLFFVTYPKHRF